MLIREDSIKGKNDGFRINSDKEVHMDTVNKPIRKKDAMQLLLGKPAFMEDFLPKNCLVVKLLRSPHANAIINAIDTSTALKVPGIEAVYTFKDIDQNGPRFTIAGQTYPETSAYDRLLLDRHVRYVGDPVAIVAGENEKCVDKALKLIKTDYEVLPAVLDIDEAIGSPVTVHDEDNWEPKFDAGADRKRNILSHTEACEGEDIESVLADCDYVIDRVYHTRACQQQMMETFRTFCEIDTFGRLHIISSTQIVFHVRRIVSNALGIPKSKIRVEKKRIGGGFGAKQTAVCEIYPAFVTWKTGKPSRIIYTRNETCTASSPRHEMKLHVRLGASKEGIIRAIDLYTLSNTGAYSEHGFATAGLTGTKTIPLYAKQEASRFVFDVVYTNRMAAGAYRGFGATQGLFAVESAVNELAVQLNMDPVVLREKNILHEGDRIRLWGGETTDSCALDRCISRVKEMIDWENKYPVRYVGKNRVRAAGIALSMQGSSISGIDVGGATIRMNEEGYYTLLLGSADMGTGSDTILAQIAAEVLECGIDNITVLSADTDISPYDSGSYASSTTYLTGRAVYEAAMKLRTRLLELAADRLECSAEELVFTGTKIETPDQTGAVGLNEIAEANMCGGSEALSASVQHSSKISPPPFMAGAAEVEVDIETGEVKVLEFDACVDCGTPINPALARTQCEGAIMQGLGMALTENVTYDIKGRVLENSLMQYKIPTRLDIGKIKVEFASSYEKSGPYGAKSIGEVTINTTAPAIADALSRICSKRFCELPITPEMICK